MSFWDDLASPFVDGYEAVAGGVTDGYNAAQSAAEQAGSAVVEVGSDAIRSTEAVGVLIGEGVVAAANTVGEGVVSFGEGVERFSVSQAGAVVDWSKTTASEVSAWTQSAAGTVAAFSVDAYGVAKQGLITGWNIVTGLFGSTLPELGPYNLSARGIVAAVFDRLADEIEKATHRDGTTVGFGFKVVLPVGEFRIGVYCDSTGQWGYYAGNLGDVGDFNVSLSTKLSAEVEIITVFGSRSDFSARPVFKLGGNVRIAGALRVGASALLSRAPGFLGFTVTFGLSANTAERESKGKGRFELTFSPLSPDAVVTQADSLLNAQNEDAPSWDAATRAINDPANEARILATALAATVSPFQPRYYGTLRSAETTPRNLSVYLVSIPGFAMLRPAGLPLGSAIFFALVAEHQASARLIPGLGDPSGVSLELHANGTTWVLSIENDAPILVPYSTPGLRSSTKATFKLVRGLSTDKGVSLALFASPTRYVAFFPNGMYGVSDASDTDAFKQSATFLLDRPQPLPPAQTALLRAGEFLRQDEYRRSGSGSHFLVLRSNAALEVSSGSGPADVGASSWSSPAGSGAGPFHAVMGTDGQLAVYRGSDPSHAQDKVWSTGFFGTPGECFAAVTAAGQLAIFRGTPEEPGDLVWSSVGGKVHWATKRRARVALRTYYGKYLSCIGGTGAAMTATASGVGESEIFELLTLWNGKVALCSSSTGKYVCAEKGGDAVGLVNVDRDRVDDWESFDLIQRADGTINLRTMYGRFLCAEKGGGGAVHADRTAAAEWERFTLVDVPKECGWETVRPQDNLVLTSAPAAAATNSGGMSVTYRGADNGQYITRLSNNVFQPPQKMQGTSLIGGPALVNRPGTDRLHTCHRGTTSHVYLINTGSTDTDWGPIYDLGGTLASAPAITAAFEANLDVFAINGAGELLQRWWQGGDWADWVNLGRPDTVKLDSPPAAYSGATGHFVFARGADKHLWHRHWNGHDWGAWQDLGGPFNSGPTVVSPGSGQLDVFTRGENNSLLHIAYRNGSWGTWERLGGRISSAPAAVSRNPGGIDVFARGMDNGLIQTWLVNDVWKHKL